MSGETINRYTVLLTPRTAVGVYGTEVDVTKDIDLEDSITAGGVSKISREVDQGNYSFGTYVFDAVTLTADNSRGEFNSPDDDPRSIFPFSRDLAKVSIVFYDRDGAETVVFKGLINEEATRTSTSSDTVSFKVLSEASVLRKTTVSPGAISNGALFSAAILAVLNVTTITSVLTVSASNISVDFDRTIDDASALDYLSVKDALDQLLLAANSVLTVDGSSVVKVAPRDPVTVTPFYFYGPQDTFGRENVIAVSEYNTGLHRVFNPISVNGEVAQDSDMITRYGARPAEFTLAFITSDATAGEIAARMLREFKAPKVELAIVTDTLTARGLDILSLVGVDYGPVLLPADGGFLPIYGAAKYGSAKYPKEVGGLRLSANWAYKVIGIFEDPASLTTTVKLRQIGRTLSDGTFSSTTSLYGSSVYGEGTYS